MSYKDFIAVDANGLIVLSGTVSESDDPAKMAPKCNVHLLTRPAGATHYFNGEFQDRTPSPTYRDARRLKYPLLEDQFDALWKCLDALLSGGTPPPDALAVLEQVKAAKAAHPKP